MIKKISEEEIKRQAAWNLLTNDQKIAAINPGLDLGKWIAYIICIAMAALLIVGWGYKLLGALSASPANRVNAKTTYKINLNQPHSCSGEDEDWHNGRCMHWRINPCYLEQEEAFDFTMNHPNESWTYHIVPAIGKEECCLSIYHPEGNGFFEETGICSSSRVAYF